ncbi:MAG: hypothetical protein ACLFVE_12340 [Chitinispirillaceae bacterium]
MLRLIDSLQARAEDLKKVGSTFSITDYVKRMNKVMHADKPAYEVIPESQELVAQYILLYECPAIPKTYESWWSSAGLRTWPHSGLAESFFGRL